MKRPDVAAIKASVALAKKSHGAFMKNADAWAQFEEQQPEMTEQLLAWVEHLEGALGKIATGHAGKEMEPYECCTCCDEYAVSVLNRDK